MAVLSKSDILNGESTPHEVYFERLGGSLVLYPLTDGELEQVESIALKGQTVKGRADKSGSGMPEEIEFDVEKSSKAQYESNATMVSISLSKGGEKWTVNEVKQLRPAGIVKEISAKVNAISRGQEKVEEAESFRED